MDFSLGGCFGLVPFNWYGLNSTGLVSDGVGTAVHGYGLGGGGGGRVGFGGLERGIGFVIPVAFQDFGTGLGLESNSSITNLTKSDLFNLE